MSDRRKFLKKVSAGTLGIGVFSSLSACVSGSDEKNQNQVTYFGLLPENTPESQGVSSEGIIRFLDEVEKSNIEFHSVMVIRHGHLIAKGWWDPYRSDLKHTLYSLSKSFTSTAIGLAVDEGKITVEDQVVSFFPYDLPSDLDEKMKTLKIKHLLTMSTGHEEGTLGKMRDREDQNWVRGFFEQPLTYDPGEHFLYNTGATYMLSAIIEKVTGQSLFNYLTPRLFDPLEIDGADWEEDPNGINVGGYGLRVRTEDIAKFGLLFLQKGEFNGKRIISEEWINEATKKQIYSTPGNPEDNTPESDWAQGYGYQFWRCVPGGYRGDGAYGQYCIVLPEYDAVVAITSESMDMQASMRLVWNNLLPAMQSQEKLEEDADLQSALKSKLDLLSLPVLTGNTPSPLSEEISGKSFQLDQNNFNFNQVMFNFEIDRCEIIFQGSSRTETIVCGYDKWIDDELRRIKLPIFPVPGRLHVPSVMSANAGWTDTLTLKVQLAYTESAHSDLLTFTFNKSNNIKIDFKYSLAEYNASIQDPRESITGKLSI